MDGFRSRTFDAPIDTVRRFVAERLRPLEAQLEASDAIADHQWIEAVISDRTVRIFGSAGIHRGLPNRAAVPRLPAVPHLRGHQQIIIARETLKREG